MLSIPFGIALQNILLLVATLVMFGKVSPFKLVQSFTTFKLKDPLFLSPAFWSLLFVSWLVFSSMINPQNRVENYAQYALGYLFWIFFPPFFASIYGALSSQEVRRMVRFISIILIIWSLVALSQFAFGWRVLGSEFVFEDHFRPRGFYSHPLSLAYAAFLLWPAAVLCLFNFRSHWEAWLSALALFIIILLSQSRMVQIVSMFLLILNIVWTLQGRKRIYSMVGILLTLLVLAFTTNPISERFKNTFSEQGLDRNAAGYADDRIAFWSAHWEMIKERPFVGHGWKLNTSYRLPYYSKIGLKDFSKPYEAHNMFIQILANGGILGLLIFLLWAFSFLRNIYYFRTHNLTWTIAWQTFIFFAATSLTQNSFQDASVRSVFVIFCTNLYLFCNFKNRKSCSVWPALTKPPGLRGGRSIVEGRRV